MFSNNFDELEYWHLGVQKWRWADYIRMNEELWDSQRVRVKSDIRRGKWEERTNKGEGERVYISPEEKEEEERRGGKRGKERKEGEEESKRT